MPLWCAKIAASQLQCIQSNQTHNTLWLEQKEKSDMQLNGTQLKIILFFDATLAAAVKWAASGRYDNNGAKAACVQYQCRLLSIQSSSKWKYSIHRRWLWMSLLHVHHIMAHSTTMLPVRIRRIRVDSMQNHSKLMAQNRPVLLCCDSNSIQITFGGFDFAHARPVVRRKLNRMAIMCTNLIHHGKTKVRASANTHQKRQTIDRHCRLWRWCGDAIWILYKYARHNGSARRRTQKKSAHRLQLHLDLCTAANASLKMLTSGANATSFTV